MTKKIKMGEYTIVITHNEDSNELDVKVFDVFDELIEGLTIKDIDDMDVDADIQFNLN